MLLDVIHVTAKADFSLLLEFENGERRYFEMAPYMDQKPWVRLKSSHAFLGAYVENGTVTWPGNIDIDPETLYECSLPEQSFLTVCPDIAASVGLCAMRGIGE
nr:DUF2442 domain-containing protein [Thiospirillum jenense]